MVKQVLMMLLIFLSAYSCREKINHNLNIESDRNYSKGEAFFGKNTDSSFFYFNRAYLSFQKNKDSINIAKSLTYQSLLQIQEGDYFGSEETSILALKYLKEPRDNDQLTAVYNAIAVARKNLKDYRSALAYFKKAVRTSKDSLEKLSLKNNLGVAYLKMKNYDQSIAILNELFKNRDSTQDPKILSKIMDNLAYTKFLQNNNYNAEPELYSALKIRENQNDSWGQNASHAHLSDYFKRKNINKSLFHAQRMYEIAKNHKNPDDQLEALQKLVHLEGASQSKVYFDSYINLNDSLQTSRNKAKNQFALIRYDTEKNRADFLKEKAQNTENNYQSLLKNVITGLSILEFILVIFWMRKRKKKAEQDKVLILKEKELEVKNTELKYSKKVHDVVANGVYQILSDLENNEAIDREKILVKLEKIYEKTRDISYEDAADNVTVHYKTKILHLANCFKSDAIKFVIIGNEETMWKEIPQDIKRELLIILQELLVNFKKHSKASAVKITFQKIENQLHILYSDNGIGLGRAFHKKNGLQNTESRIFSCNGTITFDAVEIGTNIIIHFPLNKI